MKFKYRERVPFYTEVYNEKSSLTHFVRDLSIHDQEGSEYLQWEIKFIFKSLLILFTSIWADK